MCLCECPGSKGQLPGIAAVPVDAGTFLATTLAAGRAVVEQPDSCQVPEFLGVAVSHIAHLDIS